MDHVGPIFLPKTLKIKYLSLDTTISDNLEQETLKQFQFPRKYHNFPPFGKTNFAVEPKVPENKYEPTSYFQKNKVIKIVLNYWPKSITFKQK